MFNSYNNPIRVGTVNILTLQTRIRGPESFQAVSEVTQWKQCGASPQSLYCEPPLLCHFFLWSPCGENCQLKRSQPLFSVVRDLRQPGVTEEDRDSLVSRMSGWQKVWVVFCLPPRSPHNQSLYLPLEYLMSSQSCKRPPITVTTNVPAPRILLSSLDIFDPRSHFLTLPMNSWNTGTKAVSWVFPSIKHLMKIRLTLETNLRDQHRSQRPTRQVVFKLCSKDPWDSLWYISAVLRAKGDTSSSYLCCMYLFICICPKYLSYSATFLLTIVWNVENIFIYPNTLIFTGIFFYIFS